MSKYQAPWQERERAKSRREVLGTIAGMILLTAIVTVLGGGVAALGWTGLILVLVALYVALKTWT